MPSPPLASGIMGEDGTFRRGGTPPSAVCARSSVVLPTLQASESAAMAMSGPSSTWACESLKQERLSLSGLDSREHHTPVLHSRSSPVPWAVPSRGQC